MHGHTSWEPRLAHGAGGSRLATGRPAIGRGGGHGRLRRRWRRQDQWSGQLGGAGGATSTTRAGASGLTQAALACGKVHAPARHQRADPQVTADGIDEQVPAGMRKDDPRLRAARQACRTYLPAGGPPPSPPSAQERQQALALPRCMRQHGINLPDPQITAKVSASIPRPTWTGTTPGSARRSRPATSTAACPMTSTVCSGVGWR